MVFSKGKIKHVVVLPSRSLVQMRDEIRDSWMHSIEPTREKRYYSVQVWN